MYTRPWSKSSVNQSELSNQIRRYDTARINGGSLSLPHSKKLIKIL